MLKTVLLDKALCLPAADIVALLSGKLIAALPRVPIQKGWTFALYPYVELSVSKENSYHSNHSNSATTQAPVIKAWAICEQCVMLHSLEQIEALSHSTAWQKNDLKLALEQRQHLFLASLRVYRVPVPFTVDFEVTNSGKFGKFVSLSSLLRSDFSSFSLQSLISELLPVLNDRAFAQRKHKLENLEPPDHPELEELHDTIAQLAIANPIANYLKHHIAEFLGWSEAKSQNKADQAWISTINELATRSKESDDDRKSNYQAGTDFENVVRQGLAHLGFKVEEAYKGGAGGLDLFCSEPYPLVGECKSGKSITDRAVEELDRIGKRHLEDDYKKATRLIIGPGLPTKNLQKSALISKTSIISAMTFQKLVELQAKHPGSINLIELKNHLQPGQSDAAIGQYIDTVLQSLQLRSYIVQIVKDCLEKLKLESAEIAALHTAYVLSGAPSLEKEDLYEILLELSSPLSGYLGRIRGSDWKSDRFYFLRLLNLES